jgi:hypothetical protein
VGESIEEKECSVLWSVFLQQQVVENMLVLNEDKYFFIGFC